MYIHIPNVEFVSCDWYNVICDKVIATKVNEERKKNALSLFANPRNTASGTLKLQDSRTVADRNLDCFLYTELQKDDF